MQVDILISKSKTLICKNLGLQQITYSLEAQGRYQKGESGNTLDARIFQGTSCSQKGLKKMSERGARTEGAGYS